MAILIFFCNFASEIDKHLKTIKIMFGTPEIILIALVILLLFGGKKIPEMMRGLGKGVRSFKDGMNGLEEPKSKEEDKKDTTAGSEK